MIKLPQPIVLGVAKLAQSTSKIIQLARRHPRRSVLIAAIVVGGVIGMTFFFGQPVKKVQSEPQHPLVHTESVAALSEGADAVILVGEVRSTSQAELRAQRPGKVTRVNVTAGQTVAAGTVLAEIENAQERAAVLQAQGAVAAAEAVLAKVRAGARSEDRASASAQAEGAATSFAAAQESARSAYSSAYSAAQDALFAKADTFFTNQYTVSPSFRVNTATYDEKTALGKERAALGTVLDAWKTQATASLQNGALDTALVQAQNDLERLKAFLDRVSYFVSKQTLDGDYTAADKTADEAKLAAARAAVDAARQGVSGARAGLAGAASGEKVASLTESKIVTGAQPEDIAAAQAALVQARGMLAGAQASLENSLVRTPIGGTVTSLNLAAGDFLSAQQSVAVVAREGAQEIVAYASDDVRRLITTGMHATINGTYAGVITAADPGLDPVTKRARVTVGLTDNAALTNGSFVDVVVDAKETSTPNAKRDGWYIPVAAIKVLPKGLAVLTVRDDGTLEAHEIPEGTITGDRMLVKSDLPPDMRIVTDVRGLVAGENVEVAR